MALELTLNPYLHRYVNGRYKRGEITRKTATNLECRLGTLAASFEDRPMLAFGKKAINRWLATIGQHSPATRRAYIGTVRGFCRFLVATKAIPADPTVDVPKVRQPRAVPRALPAADVARVLASAPDSRADAIIWLMVGLGLRCAEVARLEVGDYDRTAATVHVFGKADHERLLPVPPEAGLALARYLSEVGLSPGPLIRSKTNPAAHLQPHTVSQLVTRCMVDAGVKHRPRDGVTPHACRHTAASDVLDKCLDLRVVQAMLGHVHLSSTAIYLRRANLGQMRDAMAGRQYQTEKEPA